jgi:glycosyltransferase involved in cell wall biosynthesis
MRLVYLAAGAGGMYCGSCLHDNTLARALLELGHDVLLVPTYTPLRTDEENVSRPPVLMGGINVYLHERLPFWSMLPRSLRRLFDAPLLLRWLAGRAGSVRPERLGRLTLSVLRGEHGRQRAEVERLVDWLVEARPEVVHLSNSMLAGLAEPIARRLGVPVVCTLSGEDLFLERLPAPYYAEVREELRRRASHVQAFVALNRYYAQFMSRYLDVPPQRVHVIPHGLRLAGHGRRQRRSDGGFSIGYLARICPEKGLHLLVDALALLRKDGAVPPVRLCAAGYLSSADRPYLRQIMAAAQRRGLSDAVEYVGEVDHPGKIAFLQSLDVFSVPAVYQESKGLSVYEALANGVPVVLPNHGCYPELIEDTGGGLLCRPEDPEDLARCIRELVTNPLLAEELGNKGREAIHARYTDLLMAERHLALYRELCAAASDAYASAGDTLTQSGGG